MHFLLSNVLAIVLLAAGPSLKGALPGAQSVNQAQTSGLPDYPNTSEGLKKLLEEFLVAVKSNDEAKISSLTASLKFPDSSPWFANRFGPTEGARLGAKYAEMLPDEPVHIKKMFEYALKTNSTDVAVREIQKPDDISGIWRAVLQAMVQPTPLYKAESSGQKEKFGVAMGDFVYADGGFRYVDTQVWQALSTAPPMRIRQGGNVQVSKLTYKVQPKYPNEARGSHIQGVVRLHVIVAADGTIGQIELMNGDAILAGAAIEAVKQWRYHPTTLNAVPVEVDTTVDVIFSLNN